MAHSFRNIFRKYAEISVRYDHEHEAIWCYFNPKERPCFSSRLLQEAKEIQHAIIDYFNTEDDRAEYPVRYLILASQVPGVFNLGGDLNLFTRLIKNREKERLFEYAKSCIDICYLNAVNLHLPLTTISLVEGSALGGGFESALSSTVLIASRDAQMGLPEIRFNLFPGMGAYSFLARNLGEKLAEKMLRGGKIYKAQELYEMGVVDVLAEPGYGCETVKQYIKKHACASNGMQAIQQVKQFYNPLAYEELLGITKIWVDAALRLTDRDIRTMKRLVKAQNKGPLKTDPDRNNAVRVARTYQDRRFAFQKATFPLIDSAGRQITFDRRREERRGDGDTDRLYMLDRRTGNRPLPIRGQNVA